MNPHSLPYWLVPIIPLRSRVSCLKAEPVKEDWTTSLHSLWIFQLVSSSTQCCWGWIRVAFTSRSYLNLTLGPTVLSISVSFLHVSILLVTPLYTKDMKHFIHICAVISLHETTEMMHVWLLFFPSIPFPFSTSLFSFFSPLPSLLPPFLPLSFPPSLLPPFFSYWSMVDVQHYNSLRCII